MSEYSELYYINQILFEIDAIQTFIEGLTFYNYLKDLKTRYAVERALLNISEAARNIDRMRSTTLGLDPLGWKKIKGIGNVIRHDYDSIDNNIIWRTITEDIIELKKQLEGDQA
jgi:uncharacterized protein with HEPN domain